MNGEATLDVEETQTGVVSPDDAGGLSQSLDVINAIDNADEQQLVKADELFQQVYKEAHATGTPEERVQTGCILPPIVRRSARNIEQDLSITIPVVLPDGESVRAYTALYGAENPDPAIDRMVHQYTQGEPKISDLMGVRVPLIYIDGEWKLYLIAQGGFFGIRVHSWLAKNVRALVSDNDVFEFGKHYQTPFEDDRDVMEPLAQLIEETGATPSANLRQKTKRSRSAPN